MELEKACAQLRDSLRGVEARLKQAAGDNSPPASTEETRVEKIHRFVDYLISPRFSEKFTLQDNLQTRERTSTDISSEVLSQVSGNEARNHINSSVCAHSGCASPGVGGRTA
jgi:hypothetical protein